MAQTKRGEPVKIRFADDETGWAVRLSDGNYAIENIPFSEGLNIDDIVSVVHQRGWVRVDRVLRRVFKRKTPLPVRFGVRLVVVQLVAALEAVGCKLEGVVPGLCLVAHTPKVKPIAVAAAAGIRVTTRKED